MAKVGHNDPCPCGSGRKYKKCHLESDLEAEREMAVFRPEWEAAREALYGSSSAYELAPQPAAVLPDFVSLPDYSDFAEDAELPDAPQPSEAGMRFRALTEWDEIIGSLRDAFRDLHLTAGEVAEGFRELEHMAEIADEWAVYGRLLDELRSVAPELYREEIHEFNYLLVRDVLNGRRQEDIPTLLEPYAAEPERSPIEFAWLIDHLLYEGHGEVVRRILAAALPVLADSDKLSVAELSRWEKNVVLLTVFQYVETTQHPDPLDPVLQKQLSSVEHSPPLVQAMVSALSDEAAPPGLDEIVLGTWNRPDIDTLWRLMFAWVWSLHRRHGVPLERADLARQVIEEYLERQFARGNVGPAVLIPDMELAYHVLDQLWADDEIEYLVLALAEYLPSYVNFLVEHGLIRSRAQEAAADALLIQKLLLRSMEEGIWDDVATPVRERLGIPPLSDPEDRSGPYGALLTELQEAGQEPARELMDRIIAHGDQIVPELIAMATDQDLLLSDGGGPGIWAPVHAVALLGEMDATEASPHLVPLLKYRSHEYLQSALEETLGSIGVPAIEMLRAVLFEEEHQLFTRAGAASRLAAIGTQHPGARDAMVAMLTEALDPSRANQFLDPTIVGFIISGLVELHASESLDVIRQAFADHRVDEFVATLATVEEEFGLRPVSARTPSAAGHAKKRKKRTRR